MTGTRAQPPHARRARSVLPAALTALLAALPARAAAQDDEEALAARCDAATGPGATRALCRLAVQAVEIAQPRLGLALSGGNPVPGTASTLGLRLGRLPRLSAGGRATVLWAELPDLRRADARGALEFVLPSLDADAAVGLLPGFSPGPAVGGVGSLDALASLGLLFLPGDEGFRDDVALGWGVGARLGLLRESFVLPGVSLSAMYRRVEDVTYGDPALEETDAFFEVGTTGWSLRAAASKRIALFGVTAGLGYDHYTGEVGIGVAAGAGQDPAEVRILAGDFDNDRLSAFLDVSFTLLVLHAVAELGWQQGGDRVPGRAPRLGFDPGRSAFFGSFALRLSI